ncbi:Smr/MutS family protein [Corallibacter sp.]|uniref:Smr/MutS family protein n=1 Tax=Corallibacter sp. TaxID=2038084 RepID=UPI003AB56A3B
MFKKGQQVAVLDDDMIGHVVKVNGTTITIETADGFELDFDSHELVVLKEALPVTHIPISDIIKEKETSKKRKQPTRKAKEKYQPTMEVDLHIHQLTNSTRGMNNHDMLTLQLDTARRQLDLAISKRIQKVVFIHGVGQGVLKTELEYLFGRYNNVKFYEANYQKYGLGATEVYIYQNVSPN